MMKRIFIVSLLTFIATTLPLMVLAQSGGLTVRSTPDGAETSLIGEDQVVTGVTPSIFQQGMIGPYKLEVKKSGYEKYRTKLLLDPSQQMEIMVNLTPKTPFKAAVRSMFIPGWGQRYAEKKTKGLIFNVLAFGSVIAYLSADNDFDDKYDLYENKLAAYDRALTDGTGYAELESMHAALMDAQQDAYDAEDVRRVTIGAVIGVWSLSFLDALFFFPKQEGSITTKSLTITPTASTSTVGLQISHGF